MSASGTCFQNRVWVIDPANPSVQVIAGTGSQVGGGGQRITTKIRSGSVRVYGTGRVRNVIGADTQIQAALALIRLTGSQAAQLDAWRDAGTVLLFRDTYGQRIFGTIFETDFYYEPHSVIASSSPASDSNGPFVDIAVSINQVTVLAGS